MTLEQRLTRAAHRVAGEVTPPEVDLAAVRERVSRARRRRASLAVAATVAAVVAITVTVDSRTTSSSPLPVAPPSDAATTCATIPKERPQLATTSAAVVSTQREWLDSLPLGSPPLTPWWHDGVLHVRDTEVATPFDVGTELIEVAGGNVLVGNPTWNDKNGDAEWAILKGDRLVPLPNGDTDPSLSVDGRIAYWHDDRSVYPETPEGDVVAWDVETEQVLSTRFVRGSVLAVDADGIAYLWGERSDPTVTEWDMRADTIGPSALTWDYRRAYAEQCNDLAELARWRLEGGYVSPDGTREVFTGSAPGDAAGDGCTTKLRVRPVGPIDSVDPALVTTLSLPAGIPHMTLWHSYSDRGTWGVWWESNETVLLDAVIEGSSHLVRCSADGGGCERVFDLGPVREPRPSQGAFYYPDWGADWAFAHQPLAE